MFPPQWTPFNPHFCTYALPGHLISKGLPMDVYDANLQFYHTVLSASYIERIQEDVTTLYDSLMKKEDLSRKERSQIIRIDQFFNEEWEFFVELDLLIPQAYASIKTENQFYDPSKYALATNRLEHYFRILSVLHYPATIFFNYYSDPRYQMNIASIIEIIKSKDHFFETFIDQFVENKLKTKNYNVVAISINSDSQVLPGLLVAYKLKQHYKDSIHITIGGNFFTRLTEVIESSTDFFTYFADSLVWGPGEIPLEKLLFSLRDNSSFEDVPSLIYWDRNSSQIKKTQEQEWQKDLDILGRFDLSQLDLNGYLTPEIVLPLQYSRGCYWAKCTFCDHFFGPKMGTKSLDKLIDEIKYALSFGVRKFVFIDEMLAPSFVAKFSKRIIEENLSIHWFTNCRTETGFTEEIMQVAYESGLRMVLWGLESGNKRIMELINKGVDLDHRYEPLAAADKAGIWNFAFIFFGFPTETIEEAFETMVAASKKENHVDSYGKSVYTPGTHSAIVRNADQYGIKSLQKGNAEFATWYSYETEVGMSPKTVQKVAKLSASFCIMVHNNEPPLWFKFTNRDVLFLNLCFHGKKWVKDSGFTSTDELNRVMDLPKVFTRISVAQEQEIPFYVSNIDESNLREAPDNSLH